MNYKYLASILFIAGITSFSYGQTEGKSGFKKATKNSVKKSDVKLYQPNRIHSNIPKNQSAYYWNEEVILEELNVSTIPNDYPKYDAKKSKGENLDLIEGWMLKNKHLLKDKYKFQNK